MLTCVTDMRLQATWSGGVVRSAQWLPTVVGVRYTLKSNQFDSLGFFDLITEAIQAKYGYELKTETKCRYNQRVDILNTLVCSCSPVNSDPEQCFASYDPRLSVALNVLCKNSTLHVTASATDINFFFDSLVLKDVGSCTTISVSSINANQFKFPSKPDISTFLIDTNSDKNFAYLNQNNATVGVIVGDGVSFYVSPPKACSISANKTFSSTDPTPSTTFKSVSNNGTTLGSMLKSIQSPALSKGKIMEVLCTER